MKTKLTNFAICLAFAGMFTIISCDDGFKSYSNDNKARPTVPDVNGRHVADDEVYDNKTRTIPTSEHTDSVMQKNHTGVGHDQH